MKHRAGFLCVWILVLVLVLVQGSDAGRARQKPAAGVSCRPKELVVLSRSLVDGSLASFDEANGKHLGSWPPGFPQLQVDPSSPLDWSQVQCSLSFMARGLEKVLEDQRNNLNPEDFPLHQKLQDTISTVGLLATCLKNVFGGRCPSKPAPPLLPEHTFQRKQYGHTLLKTARGYLGWLQRQFVVRGSKVRKTNKKMIGMKERYFEGSGYLL